MMKFSEVYRSRKISHRMLFWFLAISITSCLVLAWQMSRLSRRSLEQGIRQQLVLLAGQKATRIESFAMSQIQNLSAMSTVPFISRAMQDFDEALRTQGRDSSEYHTVEQKNVFYLNHVMDTFGYEALYLLSPNGTLLYRSQASVDLGENLLTGGFKDTELADVFERAKTLLQPEISDFDIYPGESAPAAYIAGPVMQKNAVVGVAIFKINNELIYDIANDYRGLAATGETCVALLNDKEVVAAIPYRHDPSAAFRRRMEFGSPEMQPLQSAVQGMHGSDYFKDYRGKQVIGAWTYLPTFRWGLLVKQDLDEAFALVHEQSRSTFWILATLIVPIAIVAWIVAASITRPIELASNVAEQVAAGNLNVQFQIERHDETGQLLTAIKSMADNLRELYSNMESKIRDRTQELLDANKQLDEARVQAEEANRTKSAFLANMSHELRTPMNAIIGYSEMIIEEASDLGQEEFIPDLQKIHTAGKHLLGLINDVLDLSKIEAGKMTIYCEPIDVATMVRDVEATVKPLVAKQNNRLEIELIGPVGTMHSDLTKIRQNLFNLLSNASKFTENGLIRLNVQRLHEDGADWLQFTVSDSGIGMTPKQLGKLFQAFSQADASTTRKYGGTGLGLAISRKFCQLLGGDISVTSQVGQGSAFTMKLPARAPEIIDESTASVTSTTSIIQAVSRNAANTQQGPAVVVIDDDPAVLELMERFLRQEGFQVHTAQNGKEGLELVRQVQPMAVTTDVMMPGIDGWSVISSLKADPATSHIPIILLTIVDNREMGMALGVYDYLSKPVDWARLSAILNRLCIKDQPNPILVVEDDPATSEMLERTLTRAGWKVITAANGVLALEQLKTHEPSLVLLDLMMPEMDGFEFLNRFRANTRFSQTPVVVLTAKYITPEDRQRLSGQVSDLITKSGFVARQLIPQLRGYLAASSNQTTGNSEQASPPPPA